MTAVGELVLVLGLLVSAHCAVRARDPEVEEEEEEDRGGRAGGGMVVGGYETTEVDPGATETTQLGERGNYPARTGNWCAFVQKRVVTMTVACGTEKYTIKSQSPCPSRAPDCHLVMYKLSTRPMYTQKQKILTSLQWRCCPGHGGNNCEDTVPDSQLDSGSSALTGGSEEQQQGDPDREQNDHQAPVSALHGTGYPNHQHNSTPPAQYPAHTTRPHNPHHASHPSTNTYDHRHPHPQKEHDLPDEVDAAALPYLDASAVLTVSQTMALVMSQLQPVLEGFNRTLEHLSRQVGDLSRDVAQLKSSQRAAELQAGPPEVPELDEAAEERLNTRMDDVFQHIQHVRRQMQSQRTEMEDRLHSQHAMLHYNLTSFKTDIDMKLKRHQKMLQVSLQAMNTTLSELKLDQDQTSEMLLEEHRPSPSLPPPRPPQPSDSSALWEAIERLDDMVVNNTVKVSGLMEDVEVTSGKVQQLRWSFKELQNQINQTARDGRILFMETGLEVEAAKVVVQKQVEEFAANMTQLEQRLLIVDEDMDYLYTVFHKINTTGDCACKELKAAMAELERGVANVRALANKNTLDLEEHSKGGVEQWDGGSDLEPEVKALKHVLQQLKESLASEQSRTRTLDHSLTQLSSSVTITLAEISGLKEKDKQLRDEMQYLSSSFSSLLKDGIRHSDVLEMLLQEEVLDFLDWPVQDQKTYSIPALKEDLRILQEQLKGYNLNVASLLGNRTAGRDEVPSADQPSLSHPLLDDWFPGGMKRSSDGGPARERQLLLRPDGRVPTHRGDGSDLWNLEKRVEELGLKVLRLQEKPCHCPNASAGREAPSGGVDARLQTEVKWLKRGLEEHLRVFKNVFINADVLVRSNATLELDKLWQLVKNIDGKKEKKRRGERGGNHRNRRDSSGVVLVPSGQSEASLVFVAGSSLSISNSVLVFKAFLNQGQFYSDTGTFTAPVDGVYLFILTLDLRPGPVHVVLRRRWGTAQVSLHRQEVTDAGPATGVSLLLLREGEEVRLELRGGAWAESEDNVFAGMLLHQTT